MRIGKGHQIHAECCCPLLVSFIFSSQNGMDAKAAFLVLIELVLISAVRFKDVDRQANLRKYGVQMLVIRLLP
jgi:hypothetical protein